MVNLLFNDLPFSFFYAGLNLRPLLLNSESAEFLCCYSMFLSNGGGACLSDDFWSVWFMDWE